MVGSNANVPQIPGVAVDTTGHLYVTDSDNSRVLGWRNVSSFSNGQAADLVLGQPDFNSGDATRTVFSGSPAPGTLCYPEGLAVDGAGNLYIADTVNTRVVEYNAPFSACASFPCVGGNANAVFGQAGSFTAASCGTGKIALCFPGAVAVDSSANLYISDTGNNRVLEFNTPLASMTPNTIADVVFGQNGSFSSNACNDGTASGDVNGAGPDSLCHPSGVLVDNIGNLFIADTNNNRVLEYNTPLNSGSGESGAVDTLADMVFGQLGSFTSIGCNIKLCDPTSVAIDSDGNFFIADSGNSQIKEYQIPLGSSAGCTPRSDGSGCPGDTNADLFFGAGCSTETRPRIVCV